MLPCNQHKSKIMGVGQLPGGDIEIFTDCEVCYSVPEWRSIDMEKLLRWVYGTEPIVELPTVGIHPKPDDK